MIDILIRHDIPKPTAGPATPHLDVREEDVILAYRMFEDDEKFAVLKFCGVRSYSLGPPNDEALQTHELYPHGLEPYAVLEVRAPDAALRR